MDKKEVVKIAMDLISNLESNDFEILGGVKDDTPNTVKEIYISHMMALRTVINVYDSNDEDIISHCLVLIHTAILTFICNADVDKLASMVLSCADIIEKENGKYMGGIH